MTDSRDLGQERARQALLLLSLAVFLTTFGLFAYRASLVASFPYPIKYGEGILLDQSRRAFSEPGLYPPFEEAPYVIGNYPPVYPMVVGLLPELEKSPFFMGRLVSLLSILGTSFLLVSIVRALAGTTPGLWAGAVFLSTPEILEFGSLMRVDSLGLLLGVGGGYCFLRSAAHEGPPRRNWRLLGSAAFFLSIYTRHSLLAIPLGTFVILLLREGRRSLLWPLGLLGAGIVAFLVGSAVSGGELYTHLIYLNQLPFEADAIVRRWITAMYPWRYALVFAAAFALFPVGRASGRRRTSRVVCALLLGLMVLNFSTLIVGEQQSPTGQLQLFEQVREQVGTGPDGRPIYELARRYSADVLRPFLLVHVAWALIALFAVLGWTGRNDEDAPVRGAAIFLLLGAGTALMSGRAGADVNYIFEYLTISAAVAAASAQRLAPWGRLVLLALGLVFIIGNHVIYSKAGMIRPERMEQIATRSAIFQRLRELGGPILSEDPSIPVLLGEPLLYQPFMYRQLADAGIWNPKDLVDRIERREFEAIVVMLHRPYNLQASRIEKDQFKPVFANRTATLNSFPKAISDAVLANYELDFQIDELVTERFQETRAILVPKR